MPKKGRSDNSSSCLWSGLSNCIFMFSYFWALGFLDILWRRVMGYFYQPNPAQDMWFLFKATSWRPKKKNNLFSPNGLACWTRSRCHWTNLVYKYWTLTLGARTILLKISTPIPRFGAFPVELWKIFWNAFFLFVFFCFSPFILVSYFLFVTRVSVIKPS